MKDTALYFTCRRPPSPSSPSSCACADHCCNAASKNVAAKPMHAHRFVDYTSLPASPQHPSGFSYLFSLTLSPPLPSSFLPRILHTLSAYMLTNPRCSLHISNQRHMYARTSPTRRGDGGRAGLDSASVQSRTALLASWKERECKRNIHLQQHPLCCFGVIGPTHRPSSQCTPRN